MNELKELLQLLDPEDIDTMAITSGNDEKYVIVFMDKEQLVPEKVAYCYNRETECIDVLGENDIKIHSIRYSQLKYLLEHCDGYRKKWKN